MHTARKENRSQTSLKLLENYKEKRRLCVWNFHFHNLPVNEWFDYNKKSIIHQINTIYNFWII